VGLDAVDAGSPALAELVDGELGSGFGFSELFQVRQPGSSQVQAGVDMFLADLLRVDGDSGLKGRLLFLPGVMVTSVPWQLHSSDVKAMPREEHSPGEVRRGIVEPSTRLPGHGSGGDEGGAAGD
jgi:hypothetical protein